MEILFIIAIFSLIFGCLNGSYFTISELNDDKIINHPLFRTLFLAGVILSLSMMSYFVFIEYNAMAVPLVLFHVACLSLAFLVYSSGYLTAHALCSSSQKH